jgi:uncharacterized protein (TIGR00369 family)
MAERVDGAALARQLLEHSPFARYAGFELESLEPDRATLRLPFKTELTTTGEIVHGGAISALMDMAATIAAWSIEFESMPTRWGTAGITINFERPASSADVSATATITRRGRSLCFCEVAASADGKRIAGGSVIYSLSF